MEEGTKQGVTSLVAALTYIGQQAVGSTCNIYK